MLKQRISRRDIVPHSGNNRTRSVSPDRRRLRRGIHSAECKPNDEILTAIDEISIETRMLKNGEFSSIEDITSLKAERSSRHCVLNCSPSMNRRKSMDSKRKLRDEESKQRIKTVELKITSESVVESIAMTKTVPKSNTESSSKHGQNRKQHLRASNQPNRKDRTQRQEEHDNACKGPSNTPIITSDTLEKQHKPTVNYNSNNNANSPGGEGKEGRKSGRLSLIKRLWNKFVGFKDAVDDRSTCTEGQTQGLRSRFQEFLTVRQSTEGRESRVSLKNHSNITNNRVVEGEMDELMKDYLEDIEACDEESITQEYEALLEVWRENELAIYNNSVLLEQIDRQTEVKMEEFYRAQAVKEDQVRRETEHTLTKAQLELVMIRDMSACIDDIIGDKDQHDKAINVGEGNPEYSMAGDERELTSRPEHSEATNEKVQKELFEDQQETLNVADLDTTKVRFDDGDVPIPHTILDVINLSEERRVLKEKIHRVKLEAEQKQVQNRVDLEGDGDKGRMNRRAGDDSEILPRSISNDQLDVATTPRGVPVELYAEQGNGTIPVKQSVAFVIDMGSDDNTNTLAKQRKRKPVRISKKRDEGSNNHGDIKETTPVVVAKVPKDEGRKKPVAFVIDMADEEHKDDEEDRTEQQPIYGYKDTVDNNHHSVSNQDNDTHEDNSDVVTGNISKQDKIKRKAVAFEIDLSDGNDLGQKKMPARLRRRHNNGQQGLDTEDADSEYSNRNDIELEHAGKHQAKRNNGHSGNHYVEQRADNVRHSGENASYEVTSEHPKPTYKEILQSRLQQGMNNNKHSGARTAATTQRPRPVKGKYDKIESKVKTQFRENYDARYHNSVANGYENDRIRHTNENYGNHWPQQWMDNVTQSGEFGSYEHTASLSFKDILQSRLHLQSLYSHKTSVPRSVATNHRQRPVKVNYDRIESKIKTRFPENYDATYHNPDYHAFENNRITHEKQNYDDVKSKIQTKFPENDVTRGYDEGTHTRVRSVKHNYDGIKSKIKTRFPNRNDSDVKTEANKCPIPKAVRQGYDNIKCRIKTRFPDRTNTKPTPTGVIETSNGTDCKNTGCYQRFAELRKASTVQISDMPNTYQRPVARKASNLPLSKNMTHVKERYRLQPNSRQSRRHKPVLSHTQYTYSSASVLNHGYRDASLIPGSKSRPKLQSRSLTPIDYMSGENGHNEGENIGSCLSLHSVLPPIAPKEESMKPVSPTHRLAGQLPPIKHTPSPPHDTSAMNRPLIDAKPVTRQSPTLDKKKIPAIRGTPTPPHNKCQRIDRTPAARQSPALDKKKKPAIRGTPTPPHNICQRIDRKPAARQSPTLDQNKLPAIKRTPTPPHINGQSIGGKTVLRQSPGLDQNKLPPIRRTPSPPNMCSGDKPACFTTKCELSGTPSPGYRQ